MPRSRACRRTLRPLLEEEPLLERDLAHLAPELTARPLERLGITVHERAVPAAPRRPAVRALQGHEEAEVVEPGRLRVREGLEGLAARRRRLLLECGEGLRQERLLELDHGPEVDLSRRELGPLLQVGSGQQALLAQAVEGDEQRVARERREALVGRVAVAGGAEGEDLPEGLAGLRQEVQEGGRLVPQLTDAVGAGQRRGVEEDPGGSVSHRAYSILTSTDWLIRRPWSPCTWTLTVIAAALRKSGRM